MEEVNHTVSLSLSTERLQQIKQASWNDPVLQRLRKTIQCGWPQSKSNVSECLHAYYDFHDELIVPDELVFKGDHVIIPAAMQKEMMASVHATHVGTEGCIRRARESMLWTCMTTEL